MKMIALVSNQRMQNVIPVYQEGVNIEEVWLIRSTDADVKNLPFEAAWKDTRQVVGNCRDVEKSVGAYGIAETQEAVLHILERGPASDFIVNFTGGTKCMSTGAYLAAQEAGVQALYVDTANETLVWFHPGRTVEQQKFKLTPNKLTVPIYLRVNGKLIDEKLTARYELPANAYKAARELLNLWPQCRTMLNRFGKEISRGSDLVTFERETGDTIQILQKNELIIPVSGGGWQIPKHGKEFLTGKWLDAAAYVLLSDSGLFDDVQPNQRLSGVTNELDVLVTRNGQCAILECKSGDLGGSTTLDKLQAIRSGFGLFARTFFVTSQNSSRVSSAFRQRARQYGVKKIIASENLLQLANEVKEGMSGIAR